MELPPAISKIVDSPKFDISASSKKLAQAGNKPIQVTGDYLHACPPNCLDVMGQIATCSTMNE
jgi:hypothetical protein